MYLEELLPEFRKGAKIRRKCWEINTYLENESHYIHYHYVVDNDVDILANDWELYQEPIDWDYIIKNKCLCWFWDDEEEKFNNIGFLNGANNDSFLSSDSFAYAHCRPVRRNEITFYEDKEDEKSDAAQNMAKESNP